MGGRRMVKVIALIKKKPGLSREEFVRHYEEVHAPLAVKYFPTLKRYVRNHIITSPDAKELDFDCITEFWYDDMRGHQAVLDVLGDYKTEIGQIFRDDEEKFMDGSKTVGFLVEEKALN